jgi:hypothetical protein
MKHYIKLVPFKIIFGRGNKIRRSLDINAVLFSKNHKKNIRIIWCVDCFIALVIKFILGLFPMI